MTDLAPIILFTYKRLDTLELTINALKKNYLAKDSELIIFSDAAKSEKDYKSVLDVRSYLKTINGFHSIKIYESEENKGLANSIIKGVSQVLETYDSVIILEDDLVSSPNFLNFMNLSLEKYINETKVFSISGFSFNMNLDKKLKTDTYFLNRGWSWGWATWKDRWQIIDWEIVDYKEFKKDKQAQKEFSNGGTDLNSMLDKQMLGKLDSWAIRWFYNQFKSKGLTLYPVFSKIFNEGFGEDATHTRGSSKRYLPQFDNKLKMHFSFPENIELKTFAQKRFQQKMGMCARIRSKIETFLGI